MNVTERRMSIFATLEEEGVADIKELAERFDVSTMTIRRDLRLFEQQGFVTMNYGGAYLNREAQNREPSFAAKTSLQVTQKQAIGQLAAGTVHDGESIIIDCGTTPLQVLRHITARNVTVFTNSLPVANLVFERDDLEIIFVPGRYSKVSAGAIGDLAIEFYHTIHVDKAFLGGHACTVEDGVMQPTIEDATVKRAIMAAADDTYLVIDSTKFGERALAGNARLDEYDHVVTDGLVDPAYLERLKAACRDIMVAPMGSPRGKAEL